jgi:hypothetical protein
MQQLLQDFLKPSDSGENTPDLHVDIHWVDTPALSKRGRDCVTVSIILYMFALFKTGINFKSKM